MNIIIGLGNPGQKYVNTRHNVGFRAVDEIAANFQFPIFNSQSIYNSQISKGQINDQTIILAKPQVFMNLSGISVKKLIKNLKIEIRNLVVVHDDIDLPVGQFKIQKGRGSAGHKGVQSIINELGTKDFWRIRIGVCPQRGKPKNVERFVLQEFTKQEKEIIKSLIGQIPKQIKAVI